MEEGKEFSDEVTLETVEYEFTLRVQLSEVRMKFPCTFNLTWKVGMCLALYRQLNIGEWGPTRTHWLSTAL